MSSVGGLPTGLVSGANTIDKLLAQENVEEAAARQATMAETKLSEEAEANPGVLAQKTSKLDKSDLVRATSKTQAAKEAGEPPPIEAIAEAAEEFKQNNPEHSGDFTQFFSTLWEKIKPDDKAEKILSVIRDSCQKEGISDDASILKVLQFLLKGKGPIKAEIQKAIDLHQSEKKVEIQAGMNIEVMARASVKEGMGTPSEFKNDYVKFIAAPTVDPVAKYTEWSKQYTFPQLQPRLTNYLHALGADLKSNVTSMPQAELADKATMIRGIQAILGVPSFFIKRAAPGGLIDSMLKGD